MRQGGGTGLLSSSTLSDADRWLSPLTWLVVTGGLLDDDVHAVVGVDEGDERHQRRELVTSSPYCWRACFSVRPTLAISGSV
jgi:hypothetical protein